MLALGIRPVQEDADGFDGVGFGGRLVLAVSLQPGEAERDAARVPWGNLHPVEGDLGHPPRAGRTR